MAFSIKSSIRPRRNIKTPVSSLLFLDVICEADCDPDDIDDSETFSSDVAEGDFESHLDFFLFHDVDFKIFIDSLRASLKVV